MARLKLYRDLVAVPDTATLLCWNTEVAAKHHLRTPFVVHEPSWKGAGLVNVAFESLMYPSNKFFSDELVLITDLEVKLE